MPFNLPQLVWWQWLLVGLGSGLVAGFSWATTTGRSGRSGFVAPLITFFFGVAALISGILGAIGLIDWLDGR